MFFEGVSLRVRKTCQEALHSTVLELNQKVYTEFLLKVSNKLAPMPRSILRKNGYLRP
jgi:hypothetical protein